MKGRPSYNSFRFYIFRLNTTLSENIALPAINPTTAIIGRLIVAPAIPVDIPINVDKPKSTTKQQQHTSRDKCHITQSLSNLCKREPHAGSL